MELYALKDISRVRKDAKRVGRGRGSARGKTCGTGHNGQKSRSGRGIRIGFESGHVPLYRRLPTRGFNNARFAKNMTGVNVGDLGRVEGDVVNRETLVAAGLLRRNVGLFKILGRGAMDRALKVEAHACSAGALGKIEKAGGSFSKIEAGATSEADA